MGKSFDKRLRELGAVPFHSPAFADEATNMEETVEPWIKSLFPSIEALVTPVAVEAPDAMVAGDGGVESPRVAEAGTGRDKVKVVPMVGMALSRGCVCCCSKVGEGMVDVKPEGEVIKLTDPACAAEGAAAAMEPEMTTTNLAAEALLSEPVTVSDDIVQQNGDNMEGVWSPRGDSGARLLSCFLSAEHLEPDFACPRHELPSLRATAPDVQFSDVNGVCVDGEGGDGEDVRLSGRRRSTSTESRHTCDRPFEARVLEARYLTEGGREAERRWVGDFF